VFKGKVMKAELTCSLNTCSFLALECRASRSIKPLNPFPFLPFLFFDELKHGG
jgi:hypothetical protein